MVSQPRQVLLFFTVGFLQQHSLCVSSPILSNILCKSDGYVSQLHPNFCLCNIICIHGTPLCGVKSLFSHKNEWKWSLISCMYANARKKSKERSQTAFLHFWRLNWRWLLFTSGDRQGKISFGTQTKVILRFTKAGRLYRNSQWPDSAIVSCWWWRDVQCQQKA